MREGLGSGATVRAAALLPIRFFFGITFLYAGLDKLLDPGFLNPANAASIQAQMLAFSRASPIGGLVASASQRRSRSVSSSRSPRSQSGSAH